MGAKPLLYRPFREPLWLPKRVTRVVLCHSHGDDSFGRIDRIRRFASLLDEASLLGRGCDESLASLEAIRLTLVYAKTLILGVKQNSLESWQ